jgi:hypothetical protein
MGRYLKNGFLPSFGCHPERSEGSCIFTAPKYIDSSLAALAQNDTSKGDCANFWDTT